MLNMQDNNMEDQDWNIKEDPIFDKFNSLSTGGFNRGQNIDWKASRAKVDWKVARDKVNYKSIRAKAVVNTNYEKRSLKMYKPIIQFDLQGNFVKEWNSAKEASIAMGKPGKMDIGAVCRGKQKTAYGFIWKFKDN